MAPALAASAMVVSTVAVETMVMAWRKEEEDKKCEVKKSHFSKQVGVALERENKFFFGRKKNEILSCVEEKSYGCSLEEQYPLLEKEQNLKV